MNTITSGRQVRSRNFKAQYGKFGHFLFLFFPRVVFYFFLGFGSYIENEKG